MRQLMGINGETFLYWNTERAKCSEIERMNERQKPEKNLFPAETASYLCIHQVQSRSD